jgi:hypothetical protein
MVDITLDESRFQLPLLVAGKAKLIENGETKATCEWNAKKDRENDVVWDVQILTVTGSRHSEQMRDEIMNELGRRNDELLRLLDNVTV